ncbi:MAG: flavin reductase family protein [Desulfurococcales archaeon]|jgi:flavin reductase (DIM6/NTAB) family NADH-FMN oxidoreductase RutF|nr:flavin reductase family protein [Desulfurococcales archaeon]MCC6062230.1 flavin reductase family protein [Desulfurococcales archaeon]
MSYVEYRHVFYRPLHPRPTIVIGSLCPGEKINFMPASWNMPVSEEPPTIAVSVYRETFTYKCLEYHPEATINVATIDQYQLIYDIGSVSGEDVDKISKYNIKTVPSKLIKPPGLEGSLAIYETKIINKLDIGETRIYVFEVLLVKVLEGFVDEYGPLLDKTNILLHGVGRVFYKVDPKKIFAKKR